MWILSDLFYAFTNKLGVHTDMHAQSDTLSHTYRCKQRELFKFFCFKPAVVGSLKSVMEWSSLCFSFSTSRTMQPYASSSLDLVLDTWNVSGCRKLVTKSLKGGPFVYVADTRPKFNVWVNWAAGKGFGKWRTSQHWLQFDGPWATHRLEQCPKTPVILEILRALQYFNLNC